MAPTREPNVEDRIIKNRFKSALLEIKPENVRIISDGIGGNKFSIVIRKNIPK